jgi:predicted nucleic acid-binding protein
VIVLDASVLIAHLDARDAHHADATELLLDVARERLGASVITIAEVLVGPARAGKAEDAESALQELGVEQVALDAGAAAELAGLRASTGLKLPDCCVLMAARAVEAAAVATFDDALRATASRERVRVIPA